jgi:hypothetical protein
LIGNEIETAIQGPVLCLAKVPRCEYARRVLRIIECCPMDFSEIVIAKKIGSSELNVWEAYSK